MRNSTTFFFRIPHLTKAILSVSSLLLCIAAIPAYAQDLTGTQVLTVGNGQSAGAVTAHDSSTLNLLSGGTIAGAIGLDSSTLNISGGTLQSMTGEGAGVTINVSGGDFGSGILDIEQAKSTTVSGGTMRIFSLGAGNASITGGNFTSSLQTPLSGIATLTGTNFSLLSTTPGTMDSTNYTYVGSFFTISAKLTNNSAAATYQLFDATYRTVKSTGVNQPENGGFIFNDTGIGNSISINANASTPEPDALFLATMGIPALSALVLRRRKSKKGNVKHHARSSRPAL